MPTAEDDTARTHRTLLDHARTTPSDLYALLSVPNPLTSSTPNTPALTPSILKKAWRTTALRWHPDKNPGNEEVAAGKLDEARKAFEVLSDEGARSVFDARGRAERDRREREGRLEGRRRVLKEELERAERGDGGGGVGGGLKRKVPETEEERKEREVQRLAAEGARRRIERIREMRVEMEDRAAAESAVKRRREEKARDGEDYKSHGEDGGGGNASGKTFSFNTTGATGGDEKKSNGSAPSFSFSAPAGTGGNKLQATLARLKEAQRKQAEAQILREDAGVEAAGG